MTLRMRDALRICGHKLARYAPLHAICVDEHLLLRVGISGRTLGSDTLFLWCSVLEF